MKQKERGKFSAQYLSKVSMAIIITGTVTMSLTENVNAEVQQGGWTDISDSGAFDGPSGIAVDNAGDLFVTNWTGNTILERADGSSTWTDITNDATFDAPASVAVDSAGDLFVTNESNDTIMERDAGSNTWSNITNSGAFSYPYGIAVDSAGDLFVANLGNNTILERVAGSSTWTNITNGGAFDNPASIAVDNAGDLFVTNRSNNTILERAAGSSTWTDITNAGAIDDPLGIAADSAGDLFVTNSDSNTILERSAGSSTWTDITNGGTFSDLRGIAVDGEGNLYVANTGVDELTSPFISTQPTSQTLNVGATATLSVAANTTDGGILSYQWYSNTTNSTTGGTEITGATSDTYAVPTSSAGTTYYYVVVTNTNTDETATSSAADVTVNALTNAETPSISTQPANQNVNVGANTTLSVAASVSDGGTLSYQWYSNTTDSTTGGTKITGATSDTYTVPTSSVGKTYYYVVVTNTNTGDTGSQVATATSNVADVTVNALTNAETPSISTQPTNQNVNVGANTTLSVAASVSDGGTLSYQWYSNTTDSTTGGTKITGATSDTYTVPTSSVGKTYYYVVVTNTNTGDTGSQVATATSNVADVTVVGGGGPTPPTIITQFFTEPAQIGQPYSAQVMEISGTEPMKWSVTSGSLPAGLTLSNQGTISGTSTGPAGQYTFTVTVTDANNLSSSKQLTLTVDAASSNGSGNNGSSTGGSTTPLSNTTPTVVSPGKPDAAFQQTLTATGGTAPYTWSIVGGTLPAGLQLNESTGVISGTTNQTKPEIVTFEATDASGVTQQKQVVIDALPATQREIVWQSPNLHAENVPAIVANDAGTQTTYMPIWYVMQILKSSGVNSKWNGHKWSMTMSANPELSNIQAGTGSTSIYLDGTLVQQVNTEAQVDPSTNKLTTYMPIWYVEQVLNRIGLQSTWNGTTWAVTEQNS